MGGSEMTPKNRTLGGMGVKKLSKIVGYHLWMFPRLFESEGFASKHSFSNLGGGGNYPRVPTALRCLWSRFAQSCSVKFAFSCLTLHLHSLIFFVWNYYCTTEGKFCLQPQETKSKTFELILYFAKAITYYERPFLREMPEWKLSFPPEKDSLHSGISLQKGAFIVR